MAEFSQEDRWHWDPTKEPPRPYHFPWPMAPLSLQASGCPSLGTPELTLLDCRHARQICTDRCAPLFAGIVTELQLVR
eukprot:2137287-Prymnesium_polylepis.1